MYAWIIDRDHLAEEERKTTGRVEDDAKGTVGPRDASDALVAVLNDGRRKAEEPWAVYRFTMRDDDGIIYYTGRMITDDPDEDACYGPLGDFGMPNAGCTDVRYHGHPEMDCG